MSISELKKRYNELLSRLRKGCIYLENNRQDIDKYISEIEKIQNEMEKITNKIMEKEEMSKEQIIKGFDIV